jgi:hypothetical protein
MYSDTLTTLADVKAYLNIADTLSDALLTSLIGAVSGWVERRIQRNILEATYTDTYSGKGIPQTSQMLRNYPIVAVSSLSIDGVILPASPAFGQAGYGFDEYSVFLTGYYFGKGRNNIVISYTAGYAATPADLNQAVIEVVSLRFRERSRVGEISHHVGSETVVSFVQKDVPADVLTLLQRYEKRIPV